MNRVTLDGTSGADSVRKSNTVDGNDRAQANRHPATETQDESDAVTVSNQGATLERLVAKVDEVPDVRQDRVDAIRSRIESGTYTVSSHDIAKAIIRSESS